MSKVESQVGVPRIRDPLLGIKRAIDPVALGLRVAPLALATAQNQIPQVPAVQGFECPFRQWTRASREVKRQSCSREPHDAASGVPDVQELAAYCAHLLAFVVG